MKQVLEGGAAGRCVCVLGMSRSGTSLTARLLGLLGVYLGPEEELLGGDLRQIPARDHAKATAANPEGFWEHYRLMRISEAILRSFGGSWRDPPPLPPGWERSAQLDPLREQAGAILAESFGGHGLWGWKDPRISLTLPFWRTLVPDPRCVVCLRNPLDVAASLERRDGMPIARSLALWRVYVSAALAATSGHPRLLVPYEGFFAEPSALAGRLAHFAGRQGAFEGATGRRRLDEAVDEGLWRNRVAAGGEDVAIELPDDVASLHRLTQSLLSAQDDGEAR